MGKNFSSGNPKKYLKGKIKTKKSKNCQKLDFSLYPKLEYTNFENCFFKKSAKKHAKSFHIMSLKHKTKVYIRG
jgi:hypothetical protein